MVEDNRSKDNKVSIRKIKKFFMAKAIKNDHVPAPPPVNSEISQISDKNRVAAAVNLPSNYQVKSSPKSQEKSKSADNGSYILQLLESGRIEVFIEVVEQYLVADAPLRSTEVASYAKACIDIGEPQRLLSFGIHIPSRYFSTARFRLHYFIALLSVGDFVSARSFADDSLVLGSYDFGFLMRMIAEHYVLSDGSLVAAAARTVKKEFSERLMAKDVIFIVNSLINAKMNHVAREIASPGQLKITDLNALILQSNLALQRKDYNGQLNNINEALSRYGLRQISSHANETGLSVLSVQAGSDRLYSSGGPTVTVAVSSYNSSRTIESTLTSITAQDYQNLEILVVDDCSDDNTVSIIEQYAAKNDRRVKLLRQDKNGGTYACRNRALREASGEYFICNDSDDWAHPQRISSLVNELNGDPALIAIMGGLFRISEQDGIKPKIKGYCHEDQTSLMYRRQSVIDRCGFYDLVTVGADSEFSARVESIFGKQTVGMINKPLLFADWSKKSLSGSMGTGITDGGTMAPLRMRFRRSYHIRHSAGGDLYLSNNLVV